MPTSKIHIFPFGLFCTSKAIKYLRINLTKEVKDLFTKNCKTLKKEIEKDTNIRENSPYS